MTEEKPRVLLIENLDSGLGSIFDLAMERAASPDVPFVLDLLKTAHPLSQMREGIRERLAGNTCSLVLIDDGLMAADYTQQQ